MTICAYDPESYEALGEAGCPGTLAVDDFVKGATDSQSDN